MIRPLRSSWRINLALSVVAIAALGLLLLFCTATWLLYTAKLSQLDAELKARAADVLSQPPWFLTAGRTSCGKPAASHELAPKIELRAGFVFIVDRGGCITYTDPKRLPSVGVLGLLDQLAPLWSVAGRSAGGGSAHLAPQCSVSEVVPDHVPQEGGSLQGRGIRCFFAASPGQPMPLPMPFGLPAQLAAGTVDFSGTSVRVYAVKTPVFALITGRALAPLQADLWRIAGSLAVACALVLVSITALAWWYSGRALRPIGDLANLAREVTGSQLSRRLNEHECHEEFREVIAVFNAMMQRLEASLLQAKRFSADAAHELRTPLTILQGEFEAALASAAQGSALQQRLTRMLDEVCSLSGIVSRLLLLARADAGNIVLTHDRIDVAELVDGMSEDIGLAAGDLTLSCATSAGLFVAGDRPLLSQVLQNLLSNAVKYNRPQGWLKIEACRDAGEVVLRVSNSVCQPLPADRERLFERFNHGVRPKDPRCDGVGLGLSLVRAIMAAHGGGVRVLDAPQDCAVFEVRLPAVSV